MQDAKLYKKNTSFVTSVTSTCALCHNETASRLVIENQNRWKYQQTDVFSVQVQFHSKLTCYHHIHSFNHKSCVHVHVQMRYFSLFLQAPSFFGEYLTAVPYPCCDAPIKFLRMFRSIHRLKHMQTFSSRCLGHTWLILWGKTLYYFCFLWHFTSIVLWRPLEWAWKNCKNSLKKNSTLCLCWRGVRIH